MPELPEVDTITRELNKKIIHKTIKDIEIKVSKIFKGNKSRVLAKKIQKISRRAKVIIFKLDQGLNLLIHLKMTGQLIFLPHRKNKMFKYNYITFYFTDGSKLLFNDLRKFGYIKVLSDNNLNQELQKLSFGPEPLSQNFTFNYFQNVLKKRKNSKIKPFLLDQTKISGIGNIYGDEILFQAGIKPDKKISAIKKQDLKKIYQAIKKILRKAIKYKGTSMDQYLRIDGSRGKFADMRRVYRREGELCTQCHKKIKRIKVGSRSAYFCPFCQH